MPTLPKNVLHYGTGAPLPETIELNAGPLSFCSRMVCAYIRYGDPRGLRQSMPRSGTEIGVSSCRACPISRSASH